MRPDEIISAVRKYDKKADVAALRRACMFAEKMHHDQRRESGEKYLSHPLAVAEILLEYKLDSTSIMAALLHDTVEDTPASYDSVCALFGKDVANLVQGLTKLETYQLQSITSDQAENFQKLILASSKDMRILLIKLADRLHNMRTLDVCSAEKRRRKAQETMDIYVPLAERLGLHRIKNELEDISFKILNPTAYANIMQRLKLVGSKQKGMIVAEIKQLENLLKKEHIKGRVIGRVKMPYSLWRKLQTHQNMMSSIFDVLGFRIIVTNIPDCYRVLGLIHGMYRAVPGRFKDYISTPKDSGYRSLQTSVITPKGLPLEIQIRTEEMEEEAMFGIAAHWSYKQGVKYDGRNLPWMKEFLELISKSKSPSEFLSRAKLHMYTDKLFCFDDKGMLYSLPQGATALDFACYQGSKVALKCVGVEINEEPAELKQVLQDGDKVKFKLTSKIVADKRWLKVVTTAHAKTLLEAHFTEVPTTEQKSSWFSRFFHRKEKTSNILGIPNGMAYQLDPNCHPTAKDAIVGIEEKGEIVIHKRTCPELKKYVTQTDRWYSVEWNTEGKRRNTQAVSLTVIWKTGPESMGRVVNILNKMKASIDSFVILDQEHKKTRVQANIRVKNKDHLLDVLDALRTSEFVQTVYQERENG
ncbi:MAG: bifunctional (p)ppGpp synthetase/guanosine-3',5'-bis(diphosphate) 3'-pyrophosphohydrolase [Alphaproteobacteria bacterium]|nr:bifunctional (p)ppGpp synthetase/guanosine-3',5'-bis(diphosphate) 3'-pyrophosphohydrolase [Alphaproteobacteria bacterium]